MKTLSTKALVANCTLALSAVALIAMADDRKPTPEDFKINAEQAMHKALETTPGTIMELEIEGEDGIFVWEVELIDVNNQLMEITIDANTGELIKIEEDD